MSHIAISQVFNISFPHDSILKCIKPTSYSTYGNDVYLTGIICTTNQGRIISDNSYRYIDKYGVNEVTLQAFKSGDYPDPISFNTKMDNIIVNDDNIIKYNTDYYLIAHHKGRYYYLAKIIGIEVLVFIPIDINNGHPIVNSKIEKNNLYWQFTNGNGNNLPLDTNKSFYLKNSSKQNDDNILYYYRDYNEHEALEKGNLFLNRLYDEELQHHGKYDGSIMIKSINKPKNITDTIINKSNTTSSNFWLLVIIIIILLLAIFYYFYYNYADHRTIKMYRY